MLIVRSTLYVQEVILSTKLKLPYHGGIMSIGSISTDVSSNFLTAQSQGKDPSEQGKKVHHGGHHRHHAHGAGKSDDANKTAQTDPNAPSTTQSAAPGNPQPVDFQQSSNSDITGVGAALDVVA